MGEYGELVVKEANITMGSTALSYMEWPNNLPVNGNLQVWGQKNACQTNFMLNTLCSRFLARELGVSGRDNMEKAKVDEIVDVIQDAINSNVCIISKKMMLYSIFPVFSLVQC